MNILTLLCLLFTLACKPSEKPENEQKKQVETQQNPTAKTLRLGAERMGSYLPQLKGKRVGAVVNQTSMVGQTHLIDTLLHQGIEVKQIFAPEHGFRGAADAGEVVKDGKDVKTGLPILSLYGKNKKPSAEQLENLDVILFDIQDVGVRFYTYISTMHYIMEACAENGKKVIVLDRPNPNGWYVDGPVLDLKFRSFVGMHPIPVVHGLTVGELADMINGEAWLKGGKQCDLEVVPMENYTHTTRYSLPVKPSPNLPNDRAIELYPSICFFEGTVVSEGRGTEAPFQMIGAPWYPDCSYTFTPVSREGAKHPKFKNEKCCGKDLREKEERENNLFFSELIDFYQNSPDKKNFFRSSFFNKLAGNDRLIQQIKEEKSEAEIRQSWEPELGAYKAMRKQYLLYEDF
ncbi:DUF1343 domain-containing protein [Rapidithrix thailandica]|uniref:DUF1343 domain-containing protein n=1 Tax=Rapidithrix thailandica TaxID=413964 RepID=A0AAW9S6I3_9BACT